MKKKIFHLITLTFLLLSSVSFAATNPTWDPVIITITPASPAEGAVVTFSARLVNDMVRAENIKIVGGVDSTELFSNRYTIPWRGTQDVSFTWTATPGSHTAYFEVDPDDEIHEAIETDNLVELSFTVTEADEYQPNLNFAPAYFNWSPFFFNAGDTVTVNYLVHNIGDDLAGPFNVGLRVGSTIVMRNRHEGLLSGTTERGSFTWTADCGGALALVADCDSEVTESNEGDNTITGDHFRCVKPNLYINRISIPGGSSDDDNTTCSGPPYQLLGVISTSSEMAVEDVRVIAGYAGGSVFLDETLARIEAGATDSVGYAQSWPVGTHNVYFHVDPDNNINELDEDDNYMTYTVISVDCSDTGDTGDTGSDTSSGDGDKTPYPVNTWVKILNKTALAAKVFSPNQFVSVTGAVGISKKSIPGGLNKLKVKAIFKKFASPKSITVFEKIFSVANNSSQKFKFKFRLSAKLADYELFIKVDKVPGEAMDKLRDNTDSVMIRVRR